MTLFTLTFCRLRPVLLVLAIFLLGSSSLLRAQTNELPFKQLDLKNLDAFDSPTANWVIAGDVFMDLYEHHAVRERRGTGVLVNTSKGKNPRDIYTSWEHGDMDLELEFMMAKESNSGIYLQGRYELQLLDSWGVENPRFSDLGGIYQWWEDGKGVGGIAPRVNAARAPGLWQHLKVKFRAPRFNEQGEKIANARLEEVILNGVMIHENVELVHPTGGAVSNEEAERGPLRFQGDHGPVAFRNIRFKMYDHSPLRLDEISYQYYEGEFESVDEVRKGNPAAKGQLNSLNLEAVRTSENFAVVYEGKLLVEEAGEYLFELRTDGGNQLSFDGKPIIKNDADTRWWDSDAGTVTLSEGAHTVELVYFRGEMWGQPALSLMAEGPGIERHALHDGSSFPVGQPDVAKIVNPDTEPLVMHGFIPMGERVRAHSGAVGYPGGVNFAYDFNSGALLKIWKGSFLDLSPMWVGRGGGNLGINDAAAITFSGAPSLAHLDKANSPWPDSLDPQSRYTFNSYRYDEDGTVAFNYRLGSIEIEDRIVPDNENRELVRALRFRSERPANGLYLRVAKGENISKLPNGLYQIDDKAYYVRLNEEKGKKARVRKTGSGQELIIPVPGENESNLAYSLVW